MFIDDSGTYAEACTVLNAVEKYPTLRPILSTALVNAKTYPNNQLPKALEHFAVRKDYAFTKLLLDQGIAIRNHRDVSSQGPVLYRAIICEYWRDIIPSLRFTSSSLNIISLLLSHGAIFFYPDDAVSGDHAWKILNEICEKYLGVASIFQQHLIDQVPHPSLQIKGIAALISEYSIICSSRTLLEKDNNDIPVLRK